MAPVQHSSNKRRLPVLKAPETAAQVQPSPLVWVVYGCVIIVSLWVPLAIAGLMAGERIGRSLADSGASVAPTPRSLVTFLPAGVLVLLSFSIACGVGGAVLGRFCERGRPRHAASAALSAIGIVLVFAALGHALPSAALLALVILLLLVLGTPSAVLGYHWGRRRAERS